VLSGRLNPASLKALGFRYGLKNPAFPYKSPKETAVSLALPEAEWGNAGGQQNGETAELGDDASGERVGGEQEGKEKKDFAETQDHAEKEENVGGTSMVFSQQDTTTTTSSFSLPRQSPASAPAAPGMMSGMVAKRVTVVDGVILESTARSVPDTSTGGTTSTGGRGTMTSSTAGSASTFVRSSGKIGPGGKTVLDVQHVKSSRRESVASSTRGIM